MSNVCIIPARGGSKRIPRKNIKNFFGKPMIAWSIEAALNSNCFDQVIVSTDDQEIAEVAKKYGARIPFIRPAALANDFAGTTPVVKHAIEELESQGTQISDVLCLYATAPFVQPQTIIKAYQQFKETQADYCFTVTSFTAPIQRAFKITSEKRLEMFYPEYSGARSQDLETAYHDAGQLAWGKATAFKALKPMFSKHASPFILPNYLVQDIDTPADWQQAELMFKLTLLGI